MPKDEFDPEDPMELCGVGLLTSEDTTEAMTECFIEEFLRLGYAPAQILALFRNPHYTGMHMVLLNRGEAFIQGKITEVGGWWERPSAASGGTVSSDHAVHPTPGVEPGPAAEDPAPPAVSPGASPLTDPMGYPIPSLEL